VRTDAEAFARQPADPRPVDYATLTQPQMLLGVNPHRRQPLFADWARPRRRLAAWLARTTEDDGWSLALEEPVDSTWWTDRP